MDALPLSQSPTIRLIFDKYYPRLFNFAMQILNNKDLAEDIVQDAFVIFIEKKTRVAENEVAVKRFLYTTVKNACLNSLRHQKIVDRYNNSQPAELLEADNVLSAMIHAEIEGELHSALKSLPSGCSSIIRLAYFDGLKNQKIAEELGVSINTVKSQKQRAIKLLKDRYLAIKSALMFL